MESIFEQNNLEVGGGSYLLDTVSIDKNKFNTVQYDGNGLATDLSEQIDNTETIKNANNFINKKTVKFQDTKKNISDTGDTGDTGNTDNNSNLNIDNQASEKDLKNINKRFTIGENKDLMLNTEEDDEQVITKDNTFSLKTTNYSEPSNKSSLFWILIIAVFIIFVLLLIYFLYVKKYKTQVNDYNSYNYGKYDDSVKYTRSFN